MAAKLTLVTDNQPPPASAWSKPRTIERRDVGPFLDWVEERISTHEGRVLRQARERFLDPPADTGSLRALLNDIGWSTEAAAARLRSWRRRQPGLGVHLDEHTGILTASAELIDAALEHAGQPVWELYPEAGTAPTDTGEAFCPNCSDEVSIIDGRCPWCDFTVVRPRTEARGIAASRERHRPRSSGREPASRAGVVATAALPAALAGTAGGDELRAQRSVGRPRRYPEPFVREAMRMYLDSGQHLPDAARLLFERNPGHWANARSLRVGLRWAFGNRGIAAPTPHRTAADLLREREQIERYLASDPGYAYQGSLPPDIVWEAAYRYYLDGWGFLRIARHLLLRSPWIPSANAKALAKCLFVVWRDNGWPTRSQREASRGAGRHKPPDVRRGERNSMPHRFARALDGAGSQCDAVSLSSGRRCRKFALRDDSRCFRHSEKTREARDRIVAAARAGSRRELVDSAPFVAWVRGRVRERGSILATAEMLSMHGPGLSLILRTGGTSVPGMLTRRLIENALAAALENDPELMVPRFTDLYDTTPRDLPVADPAVNAPAPDQLAA